MKGNPVWPPEARALVSTRTTPQCASGRDPPVLRRQGQGKAQARYKVALARAHHAHTLSPTAALCASAPVSPAHSGAAASRTSAPAPPAPRRHPPPSFTRSRRPPRTRDFRGWLLSDCGRGQCHLVTPTSLERGRSCALFARFLSSLSPTTPWALAVGFRLTHFPFLEICLQSPCNSLGDAVGCRRVQHCLPSLFN